MQTITEVQDMLKTLTASEGKEAAHAWVAAHAQELPDDVREQILFEYSSDAFIDEAGKLGAATVFVEEGLAALDRLETEKKGIEDELAKRDVKGRLGLE